MSLKTLITLRTLALAVAVSVVQPALAQSTTSQTSTPYDQAKEYLKSVALSYPQNVTPITIGSSDSGEDVVGLAIGHGPTHNLVVATHHGNEYGSTAVALAFAKALAQSPIPDQTVYVVPVLNISGYNADNRLEFAKGAWLDPNRDYSGPCGSDTGIPGAFHLKSTFGLAKFIHFQNVVASATLHTFMPAVVYPWGVSTKETNTPYDTQFIFLAKAATEWSHYEIGNNTKTIYPANGTFEDYAFWKEGIWSLLFELGTTHTPTPAQVQELIQVNVPGLHEFLVKAPHVKAPNHDFTGKCDLKVGPQGHMDEE